MSTIIASGVRVYPIGKNIVNIYFNFFLINVYLHRILSIPI